ncbi:NTF2 fold immunity protein [Chryseobacterium arthrosphaerae]|uniref:NTF2 fold immunity protein n=1 Tax=Chryseobacterium arthrosphaerae TaxID=651561 RepID=UPI0031DF803A
MKDYMFLAFAVLISCNKNDNRGGNTKSKETDIKKEVISIAEKKWIEVYGKSVEKQKPFAVEKKNDSIWIVHGTFPKPTIGGVAYAEVNIKTKKVVKYTHGE